MRAGVLLDYGGEYVLPLEGHQAVAGQASHLPLLLQMVVGVVVAHHLQSTERNADWNAVKDIRWRLPPNSFLSLHLPRCGRRGFS